MSLIPSESYSFPDHFTQTITYKNDPKRKKSVPVAQPEPRKKGFFLPLRKSLGRKKAALPSTAIPEESDAESSPPLTTPSPAPVIRKSPVPPSLKPKPRWNARAASPMPPAPTSDNGGPHIGSVNIPEQKITPTNPAQPASPPQVVQSPSPNPIQVPPARV